ncbi:MAG: hypothetical protein QM755_23685 [Luteolibacter sp.]
MANSPTIVRTSGGAVLIVVNQGPVGPEGPTGPVDETVAADLSAEITRATGAEAALGSQIASEETARESGDATNAAAISAEASEREAGDTANADAIEAEASARASADTSVASTAASNLSAHTSRTDNPHAVTKAQVGLGNVDDTSDANKPVSTAQANAIAASSDALAEVIAALPLPVSLGMTIIEDASAGELTTDGQSPAVPGEGGTRLAPAIQNNEIVLVTGQVWARNDTYAKFWNVSCAVLRGMGSPAFIDDPTYTALHTSAGVGEPFVPVFVITDDDLTLSADSDKGRWGASLNVYRDTYSPPPTPPGP